MMDGAWQAKTLVTDYLNSDLPTRLIRFRNYWQLDDAFLPNPEKTIQFEPLALDHWPTIITLVTGTQQVLRDDYDDTANPKYRVTYAMRTYIWVRNEGPDRTTQVRDNLTTVIRDALVDHPALREIPAGQYCEAMILEETIREEFSDLTMVKGERYIAGAYIAYDMAVTEVVTRDTLTDTLALQFNVDVFQLPKTANAPAFVLALPEDTEAHLTWKAPTWDGGVDPIDGYRIEISTDGENWATLVSNTESKTPNRVVDSLTNGTTYYFRVGAINRFGLGAMSAPSNPVTPAVP